MDTEWRSKRADTGRCAARSASPWRKNSSYTALVHIPASTGGLQGLPRSAQWTSIFMASARDAGAHESHSSPSSLAMALENASTVLAWCAMSVARMMSITSLQEAGARLSGAACSHRRRVRVCAPTCETYTGCRGRRNAHSVAADTACVCRVPAASGGRTCARRSSPAWTGWPGCCTRRTAGS